MMMMGNSSPRKDRKPLHLLHGPLEPWNFPSSSFVWSVFFNYWYNISIQFYNVYTHNVLVVYTVWESRFEGLRGHGSSGIDLFDSPSIGSYQLRTDMYGLSYTTFMQNAKWCFCLMSRPVSAVIRSAFGHHKVSGSCIKVSAAIF